MNDGKPATGWQRQSGIVVAVVVCLMNAFQASVVDAADPLVEKAQQQRIEAIQKVAPTVVAIHNADGTGVGSGVVISPDGYVLTNFHVSSGAGDFMQCGLNDRKLYEGVVVGIDPVGDVALVKMIGRDDFPYATLGDSDKVRVGDWCYAMGNPLNFAHDFSPTVTYGIVSGTHRYQYPSGTILEYTDCIQTDASINPGNSGGPLFDANGLLIGINGRGSFEKRGRVNSGAGYAISINQIKYFLDHLKSGRIVDHATLGATVSSNSEGAVIISGILETSEAFRRGLRIDDELISFGGRPMGSVNQFKNILGIYPKGWVVPIVYRRGGRKSEILVRLQGVHAEGELEAMVQGEKKSGDQPRPGGPGPDGPAPQPGPPEKEPEEPKGDGPAPGVPLLPGMKPMIADLPQSEEIKKLYDLRPGYSNYYFNDQLQKRLLAGLASWGKYPEKSTWKMTAKAPNGDAIQFGVNDERAAMVLGSEQFLMLFDDAFTHGEPAKTQGFLLGLHQLRWLLSGGPKAFTNLYYLGSEPLDGTQTKVDVLITEKSGIMTRWYFDRDAKLIGFDLQRTAYDEVCSVRFGEEQVSMAGLSLPKEWRILVGPEEVTQFELTGFEVPR
ncbi:S1C family serine protease [Lacunimicrobium album]